MTAASQAASRATARAHLGERITISDVPTCGPAFRRMMALLRASPMSIESGSGLNPFGDVVEGWFSQATP